MIGFASVVVAAVLPAFAQMSLADAQQRAVANSANVATASASVRQRQAQLDLARNGGIPHLTGDYALSPQANAAGTGAVEQHFFTVGAGISINDLIGAAPATRAAASDLVSAQRDVETAALGARVNATKLYFSALQAIALEGVRENAVAGAVADRAAAELRERNGAAPQLDVVRAYVTLAQARGDLARAQADRQDAVDALASATGVAPELLSSLAAVAPESAARELDERRDVARALAVRPELAALLASIDARTADVTTAKQSGIPTATANAGYQKGVDTGIPVQGAQAAVHVDIPLAGGAGDRVAAAQAQVDAVHAQLVDERRTIALEVRSSVRDARAAVAAEAAASDAAAEAQRALRAVELGYREGASSSLDVSVARRTAVQASVDALVSHYARAQAFALLEVMVP